MFFVLFTILSAFIGFNVAISVTGLLFSQIKK